MTEYDPAWPHSELREIFPNIFIVTGTNKTKRRGIHYQYSRNMIVVRHDKNLTLINAVRLTPEGLEQLNKLGTVKDIIRIGAFHGRDDPFYLDHYQAEYWTLPGMKHPSGKEPDHVLLLNGPAPFPHCSVFAFNLLRHKEGLLLIKEHGGILISCDSIQNIVKIDPFYNKITALITILKRFNRPANISSLWLKACSPKPSDFVKILELDFRHLLSGHGEPLIDQAKEKLGKSVKRAFGIKSLVS